MSRRAPQATRYPARPGPRRHLEFEGRDEVVDKLRRRAEVVEETLELVEKLTVAT